MSKRSTLSRFFIPLAYALALAAVACGKGGSAARTTSGKPIAESQVGNNNPVEQGRHLVQPGDEPGDESPPPASASPTAYRPGKPWTEEQQDRFALVRVKVFPHNSRYTQPEGEEARRDTVTFASQGGECSLYPARSGNATSGYEPAAKALAPASVRLTLSAKSLKQPVWVVCTQLTQLIREGARTEPSRYLGKFFVKKVSPPGGAAYLTVVNEVAFEDYVKGVVPSEVPYSWPDETLKAQAVAARTYALFALSSRAADHDAAIQREQSGADLDDTVDYQAYLGASSAGPNSNAAVDETKGQVMLYQGTLVDAFFHADSGGHTEDAANVWGMVVPYAVGKPEIFPPSRVPGDAWALNKTLADVSDHLAAAKHLSLTGIRLGPAEQYPSGRARLVGLESSAGSTWVSGASFSSALDLRSTLFQVTEASGGALKIEGRGFGHGVGMSQQGARVLATDYRKTYDEILKFYFSGVTLTAKRP